MSEKERLEDYLGKLKDARERLSSDIDPIEKEKIISEIMKLEEDLAINTNSSDTNKDEAYDSIEKELSSIEDTIKEVENEKEKIASEYSDISSKLADVIIEQNDKMSKDGLSEEELRNLLDEYGKKKLDLNNQSIKLKIQLDNQKNVLRNLRTKKTKLKKDMDMSQTLGLSYSEYQEITSTLNKRKLVNAILDRKGLTEIIEKGYKNQTKEERDMVRAAKEEILREVSELVKENSDMSAIDAIQVLYSLDTEYKLVEEPKKHVYTAEEILNMQDKVYLLPGRVVGETNNKDYTPGKAPEDMVSYDLVEVNSFDIDPNTMNDEAEFKRVMGFDFDSDKYVIKPDEGVNGYDDGPYERHVIFEKVPKKVKQIKYDLVEKERSDFDSMTMNKEDEFKRIMGFDFDPDKYEIRIDEGVNGFDDGPYEELVIFEKVPVEVEEEKKEEIEEKEEEIEYDLVEKERSDFDSMTMNKEDEFKRIMGFDFDPDKYDIRIDEGVNGFDDNPYEELVIFEKVPKKKEENNITPEEEESYETIGTEEPNNDLVERVTLYRDADTGDYFIRSSALDRYKDVLEGTEDKVRINNSLCYRISEEDAERLRNWQDNPVSPFTVYELDIKRNEIEDVEEDTKTTGEIEEEDTETPDDTGDDENNDEDENTEEDEDTRTVEETDDDEQEEEEEEKEEKEEEEQTKAPQERIKVVTVHRIKEKITRDLPLGKNDGKRFIARNINPDQVFISELRTGQIDYNIVGVIRSSAKAIAATFSKWSAKLLQTPKAKRACAEVERRLNELSEEELEVLWTEYRGNVVLSDMSVSIDPLINARMQRYAYEKMNIINKQMKTNYAIYFNLLSKVDEVMVDKKLSKEEKDYRKSVLMKKAAECVQNIIDLRTQGNEFMSGGKHGFEEDIKAANSYMNIIGRHHAKKHKFDNELAKEQADKEDFYREALANGDWEDAVNGFLDYERLYIDNTKIKRGLFGKKSVGKTYYSPLIQELDYRPDPFLTDLITTVAIVASAASVANSIRTSINNAKAVRAHNAQLEQVNKANADAIDQAHQIGDNITGTGDKYIEGLKAGSNQNILTDADVSERGILDQQAWEFNDAYHQLDPANHARFNDLYSSTQSQIESITTKLTNNEIDQITAIRQLKNIQSTTQGSLNGVIDQYLGIAKDYAAAHPQHDLTAVTSTMEYLSAHPDAITQMTEAGIDNLFEAAKLAGLSDTQAYVFTGLDNDVLTTLLGAATAARLAQRVMNTTGKAADNTTAEVRKENQEVADMFKDYDNGKVNTTSRSR